MKSITKKHCRAARSCAEWARHCRFRCSIPWSRPRRLLAKTAANPQIRSGFCFIPHGAVMANWTPVGKAPASAVAHARAAEAVQDHVVV